jgi:hypothetical protein
MKRSIQILNAVAIFVAMTATKAAAQNLDVADPPGFFTNVASRLLSSELNLNLTRIEIYPTNQYTPAVQRLLQVTANIYDATSTNYYPTIFRPLFSQDASSNLFITGYTNVSSISDPSQLVWPIDASTLAATPNVSNLATNVYGVPWIIAAKKGFPNFNEFQMENVFQIFRKLQLTRPSTNVNFLANPGAYTISQQLTVAITNMFGVECWNSYRADYTNNPVEIVVKDANTTTLINDEGLSYTIPFSYTNAITVSDWPGYGPSSLYPPNPQSFIYAPLLEAEYVAPMIYTFNTNAPFVGLLSYYFATNSLMPHWSLLVTNRLQVVMLESNATDGSYHVLDYVQLIGPEKSVDLTAAITNLYDTYYDKNNNYQKTTPTGYNDMWDPIVSSGMLMPMGMANQMNVSAQLYPIILSPYWIQTGFSPTAITNQIAGFRAFLGFGSLPGLPPSAAPYIAAGKTALAMQAPYTPTATVACLTQWEANDPLVHYLASDLAGSGQNIWPQAQILPLTFGDLNNHYKAWGGNVVFPNTDSNPYNLALKDPLVYSSDNWNFPTGQALNLDWLGQVHRGTPWQTIYLKATDILATAGIGAWMNWTGDPDAADAAAMAPVQDRRLASLLASLLNTNDLRQLVSVNNPDPNAWLGLMAGLTALTNTASGQFAPIIISSNSPQASIIASGIQASRSGQPNQFFRDAGDVLATPQLAEQSPFLSGLNPTNQITDEACETIPSQLLSLLRADSIGSVAPANGQMAFQFTGYDGHSYAIEASSDLVNWTSIATNNPANGILTFTNPPPVNTSRQFYRSVLLQ